MLANEYFEWMMWAQQLDITSRAYLKCLVRKLGNMLSEGEIEEILAEMQDKMEGGVGALLIGRYARQVLEGRLEESVVSDVLRDVDVCYKKLLAVRRRWGLVGLTAMALGFALGFVFLSIPSLGFLTVISITVGMLVAVWAIARSRFDLQRAIDEF